MLGHTDAARHLRHYLGGSGDDLDVDPARVLADVADARAVADRLLAQAVAEHAHAIRAAQAAGERLVLPFTTPWDVATAAQDGEANWFYALGSFSLAHTGAIVVDPDGSVRVEGRVHLFDRYNWDAASPSPSVP